jgi:4-diphosphocytidyl-2C-methyl-D-erythritol kinase
MNFIVFLKCSQTKKKTPKSYHNISTRMIRTKTANSQSIKTKKKKKKNCKHVITPYYVNEKLKMKKNIVINDERERERERNPSARKGSHGRGGPGDHLHRERDR